MDITATRDLFLHMTDHLQNGRRTASRAQPLHKDLTIAEEPDEEEA